jgi:hypothetical protein
MIGVYSDGAYNMRGVSDGLISLLKSNVPYLLDYYCSCHRMNLVIQSSITSISEIEDVVNVISDISFHINSSYNRKCEFQFLQPFGDKKIKEIIKPYSIRWSSIHQCMKSITDQMLIIFIFLYDDLIRYPSVKVKKLLTKITDVNFLIRLAIIDVILEKMDIIMKIFQTENTCISIVEMNVQKLILEFQNKKIHTEINNKFDQLKTSYIKYINIKQLHL